MKNSSFDSNGQFAWDSTSITLAETCLRKYYYSMIRNIEPVDESVHLIFGELYASALERYHKLIAENIPHEDAVISTVHTALIDSYSRDFDSDVKTRPNLIRTIVWYLDTYKDDPQYETWTLSNGEPAVEHSFTLNVDEKIILCGHLDQVVRDRETDDKFIKDQKTSKYTLSDYYWRGFSPNTQVSMYTLAARILYQTPIKGIIIDAAQIKVGGTSFARKLILRTEAQLREWYNSARYHIDAARNAYQKDFYPMNTSACGNYGGCPFRELCSRPESVREQFIKADFKSRDEPWSPIERR